MPAAAPRAAARRYARPVAVRPDPDYRLPAGLCDSPPYHPGPVLSDTARKGCWRLVARGAELRVRAKEYFNGTKTKEWTGLEYWQHVKIVMDKVRADSDWNEKIVAAIDRSGEDGVKELVLAAFEAVKDDI